MRGLAHEAHWQGPQGAFFERYGAVKANPRAAFRLLQAGEAVLLFPGGGRCAAAVAMHALLLFLMPALLTHCAIDLLHLLLA